MKKLALVLVVALSACSGPRVAEAPASPELAEWRQRAEGITIIRDDWGVPHIYGKTDADVVFGLWDPLESTCRHASLSIL